MLPISGIKAIYELTLSLRADLLVLAPAPLWCPWLLRREPRTHISQKAAVPGARLHAACRLGAPAYRPCDSGRWDLSPDLSQDQARTWAGTYPRAQAAGRGLTAFVATSGSCSFCWFEARNPCVPFRCHHQRCAYLHMQAGVQNVRPCWHVTRVNTCPLTSPVFRRKARIPVSVCKRCVRM